MRVATTRVVEGARARTGVTLIELLTALAIGSFLILGALQVFLKGRAAYRATVQIVSLQQNARFALEALAPNVRMAGYFGLTAHARGIAGRAGSADPIALVPRTADCGPNWSVDLDRPIAGSNNAWAWTCTPRGRQAAGSDSFVVRRASVAPVTPPLATAAIYIESNRAGEGRLFRGDAVPAQPLAGGIVHELAVSGYYVSANSILDTAGNPVPSLRRKVLQGLRVVDEEVMPGVEDMQIELGVDTDALASTGIDSIDRYVNADDPMFDSTNAQYNPRARVVALRLWLRVRAETAERGFVDSRHYVYADQRYTPAGAESGYRRVLVSRTIYLRNARAAL